MNINVVIVEDNNELKWGLKYLIGNSNGFTCNAYDNCENAIEHIKEPLPDVVLMDIGMPGMNGIECTKRLKDQYPELPVMMCTVYEDDEKIFEALKAGASGYIVKRTPPIQLLDAIRDLYNGGSPMSAPIARKVLNHLKGTTKAKQNAFELSTREQEVLNLLSEGFRNKEVADKLCISISTVKTHINNIYEKLHVTSRVEAMNKINSLK